MHCRLASLALAVLLAPCAALATAPAAAPASAAAAPAAPAAPAAAPDMSKMGPWSRKSKNEAAIKKEIAAFFKAEETVSKSGDLEAMAARVDFPVYMATDDATGKPSAAPWTKEQWVEMMKPMLDGMHKDTKFTHKPTVKVLSDTLVLVTDDFTMTTGKEKLSGSNGGMLVKIGDQWKWKMMVEAGWGGDAK
jgi:hypothetical protein